MIPEKKRSGTYLESFIKSLAISPILITTGIFLELLNHGDGNSAPVFPANIIVIIILIISIPVIYFLFLNNPLIKWFSGVPAALSAIVPFALLILLMGFLPQEDSSNSAFLKLSGLSHIHRSFEFAISSFYLAIILGFTIVKKIFSFKLKSTRFILNHLGTWIILVSGFSAGGDQTTLNMYCYLNKSVNRAISKSAKTFILPFTLQLIKFDIEEYPPHLLFFDDKTGKAAGKNNDFQFEVIQNKKFLINNHEITVCRFLQESAIKDTGYVLSDEAGSCPSALLSIKNLDSGRMIYGWISCGSSKYPPVYIRCDDLLSLTLSVPEPKRYFSVIKFIPADKVAKDILLEVNKPFSYHGWKLYQTGYDPAAGKHSGYSIIGAVYDAWIDFEYCGIFLLISGTLLLLFNFKANINDNANDYHQL